MWRRFDIVQLLTTKNVKFLSGPSGRPANPDGNWSVVGNLPGKGQLVVAKDDTIVSIPITDVKLVARYDPANIINNVKKIRSKKDLEEYKRGQKET